IVLITGASSGIGEALAKKFNENEAVVILVARNILELERVQSEFKNKAIPSYLEIFDVSDIEKIEDFARKIILKHQKIDILINNAGISQRCLLIDTSIEDQKKLITINLLAVMTITKCFVPTIIENKGQLIAISSVMGKINTKYRSSYTASKHGVVGFYDSIRLELQEYGVNICNIMPGFVATNITKNAVGTTQKLINKNENQNGLTPEDFAKQAIDAIIKRKKNVFIGGNKEKMALILKRISPRLFDYIIKDKKVI
ncbi:MAG: SDR family NAD(P)-dependent oxidoreductase, partial [Flavobacterium sp.]